MKREELVCITIEEIGRISNCVCSEISEESHLENDLGLDSLDCVQLMFGIEIRLNCTFSEDLPVSKDLTVKEFVDRLHGFLNSDRT